MNVDAEQANGKNSARAIYLTRWGSEARSRGDISLAIQCLAVAHEMLRHAPNAGNSEELIWLFIARSELPAINGDEYEAISCLKIATEIARLHVSSDQFLWMIIRCYAASAYLAFGNLGQATQYIEQALPVIRDIASHPNSKYSNDYLARSLARTEALAAAISAASSAEAVVAGGDATRKFELPLLCPKYPDAHHDRIETLLRWGTEARRSAQATLAEALFDLCDALEEDE